MLYSDFKKAITQLGFIRIEDFIEYVGANPSDVLEWEEQDNVPYTISLIIHLLKDGGGLYEDSVLEDMVEECIPLAKLLEESSSFPHKLEEMFELQKKLNDDTNGINWELGINKFNKEINWLRCIYMEGAELIDSTPWKHWKNINSEPDIDNIQIELVDIWHFLMSYILQETNIPKAVAIANTHCIYEASHNLDYKTIIKEIEKLLYISIAMQTKNISSSNGIEQLIEQFFKCCKVSGLSFNWLQKLYIGKNCLNKFRQDHGYKEGTYKKRWLNKESIEKEDNEIMFDILRTEQNISFDELYIALDEAYKR